MTLLTLRPYQDEALERVAAAEARGVRRQLGVAATGLGKTVMFTSLAERRGGRSLVLAHRDELIVQAAAKVLEVWPELGATATVRELLLTSGDEHLTALAVRTPQTAHGVGIVKAGANDVYARVVVASVQTLSRERRLAQLLEPIAGTSALVPAADPFELVVVDEAHHAAAVSYRAVLEALRAGESGCDLVGTDHDHERLATPEEVDNGHELGIAYDECPGAAGPLLLGVTATPDRGDGKGLDDLFTEVVFAYDILWGIRSGYLSDVRGLAVRTELDLSDVKRSRGDFEAGSAGKALEDAGAPDAIVRAWLEHAKGRPTIVFTPTVALAASVAEAYQAKGVRAGFVHGGTPLEERRDLLRRFSAGDLEVMANCAVLTEGYDEPSVSCIVQARPTESRALYTQMVGRGLRKHPDKVDCLVLDVVGNSDHLSLVTVPSLFGVERKGLHDGSELVTDAVGRHEADMIAAGKLRAEDVELFAKVSESRVPWVQYRHPDERRRYLCELGKDKPSVVLLQLDGGADLWRVGVDEPGLGKRILMDAVSLELAQGVGDDFARKHGQLHLLNRDAAWRSAKPSPKQRKAAAKWRMPNVASYATAGDLSDALTAHIAERKAKSKSKAG